MQKLRDRITHLSPEHLQELVSRLPDLAKPQDILQGCSSRPAKVPLSFAQEQLWLAEQLETLGSTYNLRVALRFQGVLHPDALTRSFEELVRRHEILRTHVAMSDGNAVQVIRSTGEFFIEQIAVEPIAGDTGRDLERHIRCEATRAFNLGSQLFRVCLMRVTPDDHLLLIVMHHLIADGWSLDVLIRELKVLYDAYANDLPSPLLEPTLQYADYAMWQRRWLQGEVLERQLSYWRQQLAEMPAGLELPTLSARPGQRTFAGARHSVRISRDQIRPLIELSRREGVTLYMVLLAGLLTVLSRWSRQEDVVIGTPVAGRTQRKTEDLIGFFINTLVLRTDLSGNPTFLELLKRVREVALGAYEHQDLPFGKLVADLRPQRNHSRQVLFRVTFALQNFPVPTWGSGAPSKGVGPALTVTPYHCELTSVPFDLSWYVFEAEDSWLITAEYATDLFERSTIERLVESYWRVMEAAGNNPALALSELPILSDAQRQQLVSDWNATDTEYPRSYCVHELFEAQVILSPNALAVISDSTTLTYRQLNARANQLARYLHDQGMVPGEYVSICMDRSVEMLVAQLAVLKCGGAYVPVDPHLPSERQLFIIQDCGARLVLGSNQLRESGARGVRWINCTDLAPLLERLPTDDLRQFSPGVLTAAYVMYTSGSTGAPKGVVVPHQGINRLVRNTCYLQIDPTDCVVHCSNPAFDASTFEIWAALLNGARVLVVSNDKVLEAPVLAQYMRSHQATVLFQTTALFNQYIENDSQPLSGLRYALFGGEQSNPKLVRRLLAADRRPEKVLHVYGPTETTTFASWHPLDNIHEDAHGIPIGRAISNTRLYVLDEWLQPVPIGVTGEIYVGGDGVALGYLNRPRQTAEHFIADPFRSVKDTRMYRTGDLGRWSADGSVEFLGRNDNQVKIRGYRIELEEIEAAILRHPHVKQAVVVVQGQMSAERQLVAYTAGGAVDAAELRTHLKTKLPEHMLPSSFVLLDALPLTPSGKVDRKSLPAAKANTGAPALYVAPRTPTEEALAGLWIQVLQRERIGIHDDFFEAGGHSLLAMQLVTRIRECFEVQLPAKAVFESSTVYALAERIDQTQGDRGGVQLPHLHPRSAGASRIPMSFAQERLWFLEQLESLGSAYHMSVALRLEGSLAVDALERSVREIVHRHESLRTHFDTIGGRGVQVIESTTQGFVERAYLPEQPGEVTAKEVQRLLQRQFTMPFDLHSGPLFRAFLLKVAQHEHVLLITIHHIVSDGWSLGILQKELFALYGAYLQGVPSPLAEISVQYADYAMWQRCWLQGPVLAQQLSYWRGRLSGMSPVLQMPTDRPRPKTQTFEGARQAVTIDEALCKALRDLARREKVTLNMVVLAALKVVLSRWSGQKDVVVGVPVSGRVHRETEGLIGLCVNNLVLRTDLSGNPTFLELLGRVRDAALGAYAHQHLPFEKLVAELRPQRDRSRQALFQVMFSWHNAAEGEWTIPGLKVSGMAVEWSATPFDMSWYLIESAHGLSGAVQYATDLFDAGTIARLVDSLINCLKAVV